MKSPFIQLWNVLTIPAFGFADRWIKNSVICVIVLAAAASVPARAANHAVLSSCANNGDGTSWSCASTNGGAGAFNAIPSTLARGDSYYFGVGNYTGFGPLTLSTADSGASLITWKATTAADYGGLSGFNSSTMVGQAVLPPLDVTSDYWNIDGVYSPNGDENTEPFFPAQCPIANQTVHSSTYKFITCSNSGYGFKIENWSGNDCSSGPCAPVATWAFVCRTSLTSGNNITLQFTDVEGSMDQTSGTDGCDMALAINVGGTHSGGSNIHILYDYMHDQILGNYFDATQNTWVDHVYALRNTVCSSSPRRIVRSPQHEQRHLQHGELGTFQQHHRHGFFDGVLEHSKRWNRHRQHLDLWEHFLLQPGGVHVELQVRCGRRIYHDGERKRRGV